MELKGSWREVAVIKVLVEEQKEPLYTTSARMDELRGRVNEAVE